MSSRHAIVPRGLNATRSPLSQGRFGRMFRKIAPATFGPNDADNVANLSALAGEKVAGTGVPDASDLPRFKGRALIGDPRNDENSIVSQFQALMLRFHNRMVDDNDSLSFEEVQQRVRFHYQYVVLNDFLPRIVH